jgi:hypothetical protein
MTKKNKNYDAILEPVPAATTLRHVGDPSCCGDPNYLRTSNAGVLDDVVPSGLQSGEYYPPSPVYDEQTTARTKIRWHAFRDTITALMVGGIFWYFLHILSIHTGSWQ